jgi:hemolysin activation/secretion protein
MPYPIPPEASPADAPVLPEQSLHQTDVAIVRADPRAEAAVLEQSTAAPPAPTAPEVMPVASQSGDRSQDPAPSPPSSASASNIAPPESFAPSPLPTSPTTPTLHSRSADAHGGSPLPTAPENFSPERLTVAGQEQWSNLELREINIPSGALSLQAAKPDLFVTPSKPLHPNPDQPTAPALQAQGATTSPNLAPVVPAPQTVPPEERTPPIKSVEVIGSSIFGPPELDPITQPLVGQSVTIPQIQAVADAITQLYLNGGYITSFAKPVAGTGANEIVQIRVIEGRIEEIEIEGNQRLNQGYIRSRIELGSGTPLNSDRLEDQLKLLRADPLFETVEASLRAGDNLGQSILKVRVKEANPFIGKVEVDNFSPPSVGDVELGTTLTYQNLTGIGDVVSGYVYPSTTGGALNYGFSYQVPINPMNGTLALNYEGQTNRVTQQPFEQFGIRGNSNQVQFTYRQPLIRTPRQEFALSLGFAYQNGQTFLFDDLPFPFGIGPDADGRSITSVIQFGQDYVRRDVSGAWAVRSLFNFGTGLFNATSNPGDIPDGQFFSWLGQLQRVQQLNGDNLLILQADVQLTPNSLLPSQQFTFGDGLTIPGYRQNVRSGDNGFRFLIEDRITLRRNEAGASVLLLAPFATVGSVWNAKGNPNLLPRQNLLASVGVGLIMQPNPRFNLRLDYGYPLVKLSDRGNNLQDASLYFRVSYNF